MGFHLHLTLAAVALFLYSVKDAATADGSWAMVLPCAAVAAFFLFMEGTARLNNWGLLHYFDGNHYTRWGRNRAIRRKKRTAEAAVSARRLDVEFDAKRAAQYGPDVNNYEH